MKIPNRLQPLVEDGLIDDVTRQLMSGKEAMVFVVVCGDEVRCAKVYKEAEKRSFRQSVDYTEGRKVKNSRQARAMQKGSKYGRESQEAAWQSAEVDALYRLAGAGVRVPTPYNFYEGVLLMELVTGDDGNAAPRLNDVQLSAETAREYHAFLISQVAVSYTHLDVYKRQAKYVCRYLHHRQLRTRDVHNDHPRRPPHLKAHLWWEYPNVNHNLPLSLIHI